MTERRVCFYIPVACNAIAGSYCMVHIIVEMVRSAYASGEGRRSVQSL